MKRLKSHTVAARLVLNRETLRRLGADDLEHAVGATNNLTCTTCTIGTKKADGTPI